MSHLWKGQTSVHLQLISFDRKSSVSDFIQIWDQIVLCEGIVAKWLFQIIHHLTLSHKFPLLIFGKNDWWGFWSNTTSSSWTGANQTTGTFDGRVPLARRCGLQVAAGSADESIGNSCVGETRRGPGVRTGMRSGDSKPQAAERGEGESFPISTTFLSLLHLSVSL